jgi:hypothetical protein
MLEVLEAQGKRQAPGSQTTFNTTIQRDLSAGGMASNAVAAAGSPTRLMSFISDTVDNIRYGRNTDQMARILTDPRSVDLMRQLAKEAPTSARAAALTGQILALQAGVNAGEPNMPNR